MNTPTLTKFKKWSKSHKSLAEAVSLAKAFAQAERERVDTYIRPIFDSFGFVDRDGNKIARPSHLFLVEDEVMCSAFYAECGIAHREHGFTGPEGHCPALLAESLLIQTENGFIDAGCKLLGIESTLVYSGEERGKMLDLLLGACLLKAAA